jgi:hypothetical protein
MRLFLLSVLLVSCEKDKIPFEYNVLDPESGKQVLFLDSVKNYVQFGNSYRVGYYHFNRGEITASSSIKDISLFRNGTSVQNIQVPSSDNAFYYDYAHISAGTYTFSICFNDASGNHGKQSNEITINIP